MCWHNYQGRIQVNVKSYPDPPDVCVSKSEGQFLFFGPQVSEMIEMISFIMDVKFAISLNRGDKIGFMCYRFQECNDWSYSM